MNDNIITFLKRIRIIAAAVAAFIFGSTAWEQLAAEGQGLSIPFLMISALLGFAFIWIVMTIVIYIVRAFKKNGK